MTGEPVYFEVGVGDTARARRFYGELLNWKFEPGSGPDGYQIEGLSLPGGLHGGGEPGITMYFSVGDIDAAIARVEELGGHADEIGDETGGGRYARCRDDQGVAFALWQPTG